MIIIGKLHGRQLFTANGTFTVPTNVTTIYVTGTGGGGGGIQGGAGGGAGSCISKSISVTSGDAHTVTIGVGGEGGNAGGSAGFDGGDTTLGAILTLGGGKTTASNNGGNGGSGYPDGSKGQYMTSSRENAMGGSSLFGTGAFGTNDGSTPIRSTGYGAGGTGTYTYGGSQGGDGFLLIEW